MQRVAAVAKCSISRCLALGNLRKAHQSANFASLTNLRKESPGFRATWKPPSTKGLQVIARPASLRRELQQLERLDSSLQHLQAATAVQVRFHVMIN